MNNLQTDPAYVQASLRAFFAQLQIGGVKHVAISPGSRSGPITIAADRTEGIEVSIHLDERSGGFFALGLAKITRRPVALICTSGTATANYLPAVIEAFYSGVPLIVITADRPPELQKRGAPQTINQQNLYGKHTRHYIQAPVAGTKKPKTSARLALLLLKKAAGKPPGPVHLNWPIREPLEPSAIDSPPTKLLSKPKSSTRISPSPSPLPDTPRGLLVAGPMDLDRAGLNAIADLSTRTGWPLIADPASGLRYGIQIGKTPVVSCGEHLFKTMWADKHVPEILIQLGAMPTSKQYKLWLEKNRPKIVLSIDHLGRHPDPVFAVTDRITSDPGSWASTVKAPENKNTHWTHSWREAQRITAAAVAEVVASSTFDEPSIATAFGRLKNPLNLVVSNSMPIRDLDAFLTSSNNELNVIVNRGANGIDGQVSTALGVAIGSNIPTVLFIGDLALLHDLSGLTAAGRLGANLTVVVADNNGGGIFSFLPITNSLNLDHHRLFHTPHGLDLSRTAELASSSYVQATNPEILQVSLEKNLNDPGLHMVHVPVDPAKNVKIHLETSTAVALALKSESLL